MLKYIRILSLLLVLTILSILIYKFRPTLPSPQNIIETIAPQPTIIKDNGLPNKHQIKAIFVPQSPEKNWDEPWQDACEEAALLTVHYYYQDTSPSLDKIKSDLNSLFDFESQQAWTSDINITQMASLSAKLWGYQTKIIDYPTLNSFKEYLSRDIPLIVSANGKILFRENKHFNDGGPWYHNLVILGYDDNKNQFTVHDVGTQFGAYFHYSYNTLIESIHDFPSSLKKEEIDSGIPRALILLK